MSTLLAELGKKLAEKWFTLLVLPGALFIGALVAAHVAGWSHPFDVARLVRHVTGWAKTPAVTSPAGLVLLLATVLVAAAAAGLAAQAIGSGLRAFWLADGWPDRWPLRGVARRRVERRRTRWKEAYDEYKRLRDAQIEARRYGRPCDPAGLRTADRALARLGAVTPARPTWMGDRINAVAVRLEHDYELNVAAVWPHLWLIAPDSTRAGITAAVDAMHRATTLAGWGVLYLAVGMLSWPWLLVAAGLGLIGWRRSRVAVDAYARLVETTARLHAGELAVRLGIAHTGVLTADTGRQLSRLTAGPDALPR